MPRLARVVAVDVAESVVFWREKQVKPLSPLFLDMSREELHWPVWGGRRERENSRWLVGRELFGGRCRWAFIPWEGGASAAPGWWPVLRSQTQRLLKLVVL